MYLMGWVRGQEKKTWYIYYMTLQVQCIMSFSLQCLCIYMHVSVHSRSLFFLQLQSTSLSRLFVSFLESESTPVAKPHPPILPTTSTATPPGYIDPRTDPDRPSLATAPLLKPHPLPTPLSATGIFKPVPEKPSPTPIPKLDTSVSTTRQVTHLPELNKQNTSSLFMFTPAKPSYAESAGSSEANQASTKSLQSSILRNVLSE